MASIDGSRDGARTRVSPKLITAPKRDALALRLAALLVLVLVLVTSTVFLW